MDSPLIAELVATSEAIPIEELLRSGGRFIAEMELWGAGLIEKPANAHSRLALMAVSSDPRVKCVAERVVNLFADNLARSPDPDGEALQVMGDPVMASAATIAGVEVFAPLLGLMAPESPQRLEAHLMRFASED